LARRHPGSSPKAVGISMHAGPGAAKTKTCEIPALFCPAAEPSLRRRDSYAR
jgi:hypothetical protein